MTAVKPTIMEIRAPKMSRESTSRPMWSVPSRNSMLPPADQAGGLKRWPREPISGLWGAMKSARAATTTRVTRMPIGTHGSPSVLARRDASRKPSVIEGIGAAGAGLTLIADPRVDDRVQDIDDQVDDDDHGAAQQDGGLHDREVAEGDALVEQPADARPREDGLHHHGDV